jgi:hypothetical protein
MPDGGAWKRLYGAGPEDKNKNLLMGMFVLSSAFRVKAGQLDVPGGDAGAAFWSSLVGKDCRQEPLDFIVNLATRGEGKLNYLFTFAYFLPPPAHKIALCHFDADRMAEVCNLIALTDEEKLTDSRFPRLRSFNFFSLLYALREKGGAFDFPYGISAWFEAVKHENADRLKRYLKRLQIPGEGPDLYHLYSLLLKAETAKKRGMGELQKFISIYTRFHDRPELLTPEIVSRLYRDYEDYNILIDFIEKIPIRKPATLVGLLEWVRRIEELDRDDREIFTALFQSLLEIVSGIARRPAPGGDIDFDRLVQELIRLPLDRAPFYDALFRFLDEKLKIRLEEAIVDESFADFVSLAFSNQTLHLRDALYEFTVQDLYKKNLAEIGESQEICSLSMLLTIDRLLGEIMASTPDENLDIAVRLRAAFNALPNPGISDNAPKPIRDRFKMFDRTALSLDLHDLFRRFKEGVSPEVLGEIVSQIKHRHLLPHLKDYLLTFAYAINAPSMNLKSFLNPNLIRLHDWKFSKEATPWNDSGAHKPSDSFMGFHFRGGLSRLNIAFAGNISDHLFGRNYIYNAQLAQAVIVNVLDFYPVPAVNHSQRFTALLLKLGLEVLSKAGEEEDARSALLEEAPTLTAGYHYRRLMAFLAGEAGESNLFFNEILEIGERFFRKGGQYLEGFSDFQALSLYSRGPLAEAVQDEIHCFGNIYYHTFGSLTARKMPLFPQELALLFDSGWVSGERINEFKVKVAFHAYQKKVSPLLSGQLLYRFLFKTARQFYSQNHERDYFSTYFIFNIFNNSFISRTVKRLNQQGYLRIK